MNTFNVGDNVICRDNPADQHRLKSSGFDYLQPQIVASTNEHDCITLEGAAEPEDWFAMARFEAHTVQGAAPVEAKAVSPFVLSRQLALDAYGDSRKRLGAWHGDQSPRGQGFTSGYEAGYKDGILAAKAQAFTGQFSAATMARDSDPQTSKDAAQAVARKAGKIAHVLLQTLGHHGSLTGKELAALTGIPLNSITPRFAQLRRAGLIHAVGGTKGETIWSLGNGVAV